MADTSLTVVGAGIVGLAVAARLAPRHPDLVVLERRERHGHETSSRNSEVIHAGIYYPTGSLKARLCVRGNTLVYEIGEGHGVPHRRLGKLIVALAEGEVPALQRLVERGRANGVELRMLSAAEARALEPNVPAVAAMFSPNTGIVCVHGLMDHFARQARAAGAVVQTRTTLAALERRTRDYRLTVRTGGEAESFTSELVVNAAGLDADTVATLAGIDVDAAGYRQHWWKGSYFSVPLGQARLVSHLVYPLPEHESLGVHVVLGLDGRLRFGPDMEYLPGRALDYRVDPERRAAFAASARRLLPGLREDDFNPDLAGIRAKLQGPGGGFRDFVIAEESARGLPGFVNLIGIDSPGLSSAPAIAEHVAGLLAD